MILTSHQVHCPNCGRLAERQRLDRGQLVRTQCAECDYLMITCAVSGQVVEAYAPGLCVEAMR